MTTRRPVLALAALAAVTLAACGSDGDGGSASSATTAAASTTAVPTTAASTTAAPTTAAPTTAAPTTVAPTAAGTGSAPVGAIVPGADPDVDAVVAAYSAVFDSAVPFEQKQPHLLDAAALRPTIDKYATTGAAFGGIKLQPTAVAIAGDTATVTYDVLFAGTPAYEDLSGTAVRQGGSWVVTREEFCGFMTSARTPCEG